MKKVTVWISRAQAGRRGSQANHAEQGAWEKLADKRAYSSLADIRATHDIPEHVQFAVDAPDERAMDEDAFASGPAEMVLYVKQPRKLRLHELMQVKTIVDAAGSHPQPDGRPALVSHRRMPAQGVR